MKNIYMEDIPSKKYNNKLEKELHYGEISKKIESDQLSSEDPFWSTTLNEYIRNYIFTHIDGWNNSNYNKRCRDFNHILDIILKKIKEQPEKDPPVSYKLIELYIYNSAKDNLKIFSNDCTRDSKLSEHSNDIENMKEIDDLCEDITFIKKHISEIHTNVCKEIENYLDQQIATLKNIYTTSSTKYSKILGYYRFTSFNQIDDIMGELKSKCQEGTRTSPLTGDHSDTSQYTGRNASIVAVTSLSGILSAALLLYKTTPFGSIMNNIIQKRIKFGNNLNEEIDYETLEEIPESSHNGSYNILYNTVGDS
ncbi:hypothetical protein POWCR01_000049000 [Plasmodium ovale]|uniref:PIR protein n=1 Tax=Plasmodium ovale TaxID=36330 RepID=A0A1C3KGE8_PLAOA|nr:hypothetical protein POWCR01_000049000 [Plasmodium ovale]